MSEAIENPAAEWSLEQLGVFCIQRHKRVAKDAWQIGRAMRLAKDKCVIEQTSFTEWKRTHGFSDAMVSRYMRLHRAFDSEEKVEEIGIMDALRTADIVKHTPATKPFAPAVPAETDGSVDSLHIGSTKPSSSAPPSKKAMKQPQLPSWAVPDDDFESPQGGETDDDVLAQIWSDSRSSFHLAEHIRSFKEEMTALVQEDQDLENAEDHLQQAAADIYELIRLLPLVLAKITVAHTELQKAG